MSKQITMPDKDDEPTAAEIGQYGAEQLAEAMRAKLDDYKRKHGLQVVNGYSMLLFARAAHLLSEPSPAVVQTPEGYVAFEVPSKHAPTVQATIDYLQQTDPA